MRSNVAKLLGLLLVWWYSELIGCLFGLFVLYHVFRSLYNIYRENTSDRQEVLTVNQDIDVVVVSGCDSGIGKAVADKLSEKFFVVATVMDAKSPAAVALANKGVKLILMDLTADQSIETAVTNIRKLMEGKRLHGIVNNAGICIMGELDWLDLPQIDAMMKVNLTGPLLFTKLLLPEIFVNKSRIVNVTGLDGISGASGLATYCSSKFGMEGLTESLRLELAKYGVRVITVRPGDYSSLTSAAQKQQNYSEKMWSGMSDEKRVRYAANFEAFGRAVESTSGKLSAANFDGIRTVFDEIMTATNPEDEYNEGNNLNIIAHKIIALLPKEYRGKLREKIMSQIMNIHLYL